jgi:hypothetical protein
MNKTIFLWIALFNHCLQQDLYGSKEMLFL